MWQRQVMQVRAVWLWAFKTVLGLAVRERSCVTRPRIVFSMPGPGRMFGAVAGVALGLLGLAWIFIARWPSQWVGITFTIVGFLVLFMFGQVPD